MLAYTPSHSRQLPHLQPRHRPLFVTIRSADPIPEKYLNDYHRYIDTLIDEETQYPENKELKIDNNKRAFACLDEIYARYHGEIDFTEPESVASLITENIRALNGDLCHIYAYTIMPNHLHLLLRPEEQDGVPVSLAQIMQKLKGVTARQVNLLLRRTGSLWYREYYDHWVRSVKEFVNIVEYIRQNPVKAGLVKRAEDWKWTWMDLESEVVV